MKVYLVTTAVCFASVIASTIYLSAYRSTFAAIVIVASTQVVVYGIIAGYARACRQHLLASWIVLAVAGAILPLTYLLLLQMVSPAVPYRSVASLVLTLSAELIIAMFGGYLGFALVEGRRLKPHNPGALPGKMAVAALFAIALAALAGIVWSA
jgi:hypothetical protein